MVLPAPGAPLQMQEREDPIPGEGQIRVKVSACGVCRTDLHVVDAELPDIKYPVVPGHEIVGRIDLIGRDVVTHRTGDRVGIPWLGHLRRLPVLQERHGKSLRPAIVHRLYK